MSESSQSTATGKRIVNRIDREEFRRLCELSAFAMGEEEYERLYEKLNETLAFVTELNMVEDMAELVAKRNSNIFRDDRPEQYDRSKIMQTATKVRDEFFVVKKSGAASEG